MTDIVIVNWNSGSLLHDCIVSILHSAHQEMIHTVFVVDNASEDDSIRNLPLHEKIKIVQNQGNLGFAKAANQGFRLSTCPYTLLLNPDTRLNPETLEQCQQFMDSNPDIDILGCQLVNEFGEISPSCSRFPKPIRFWNDAIGLSKLLPSIFKPALIMVDWNHESSRYVDQVMGAFMFMKNDIFKRIGYFDEQFFVYLEELDFSLRVAQSGGKSYFNSNIQIFHAGEGTTSRVKGYRLYLSISSRIKYAKKHFGWLGCISVKLCSLVVEPFTRSVYFLLQGKMEELSSVREGYTLLLKNRNNIVTQPPD